MRTARPRLKICAACLLGAVAAHIAGAVGNVETLRYEGFVAGVKAATATVHVRRGPDGYEVLGDAEARGIARLFGDWRSDFFAVGRLVGATPELVEYGYVEREGRKYRDVYLSEGLVRVIKNGNPRPTHPVLPGVDVLTAAFIRPTCDARQVLHTGRRSYRLSRIGQAIDGGCRYLVVAGDGDRYKVRIQYGAVGALTVPVRFTVAGFPQGKIILVDGDEQPHAEAPATVLGGRQPR